MSFLFHLLNAQHLPVGLLRDSVRVTQSHQSQSFHNSFMTRLLHTICLCKSSKFNARKLVHKPPPHSRTLLLLSPSRQSRLVSHNNHSKLGPGESHIHPTQVLEEPNLSALVAANGDENNNIGFAPLKAVNARNFDVWNSGKRSLENLGLP